MTISISIDEELVERIKAEAIRNHRSLSGQVAFFCAEGLSIMLQPDTTAPQPTIKAKS